MATSSVSLRRLFDDAVSQNIPITPFRMLAMTVFEDRPEWETALAGAMQVERELLDQWMAGTAIIPQRALLMLRGMACGQMAAIDHAISTLDATYGVIAQCEVQGHA